ncbi:MAG: MBOAT family O-acyltransferase [Lachnospiraceae bacterium]
MFIKNSVLLFASLVFYAWGGVQYLIVLLVLILINFLVGKKISTTKHRKSFLALGVGVNLLTLGFFKYFNFFIANIEFVLSKVSGQVVDLNMPYIPLPIGISFFIFQIMSYLIDVYRNDVPVQKNIEKLALYIMMFPQLIAGPIVRYADVNVSVEQRSTTLTQFEQGIQRFILGFFKKVLIANSMGSMADIVFSLNGQFSTVYAWLGAICYSLQIFFDFSAYSDMAIGLGHVFGFHFNENFNYPYISKSIQEFWRRWHISLSTWFKDYVYIPLGGSRKGEGRTYINLFIVFLLTGFWHGAAWQFVIWGLYHGVFLIIERLGLGKVLKKGPRFISHFYALFVVIIGWVFFRADNISIALNYIKNMLVFNIGNLQERTVVLGLNNIFFFSLILGLLLCTPVKNLFRNVKIIQNETLRRIFYLALWCTSVIYMVGLSYNPFIYFKF